MCDGHVGLWPSRLCWKGNIARDREEKDGCGVKS